MFAQFKAQRVKGIPWQIADHVRNSIVGGELSPGSKLPPTPDLAVLWSAPVATVHAALTALVKEGFLIRCPGRGTFVQKRDERLACVGIYHAEDIWLKESSAFQRAVHVALKEHLRSMDVQLKVWIDPRSEAEQSAPWNELLKAAQNREIQALIVPGADWTHLNWLNKLPIPSAHLSSGNVPNRVSFDLPQFAELSLRCLSEQGCRSIALICSVTPRYVANDGSGRIYEDFFAQFVELSRELGLTLKNEWMRVPKEPTLLGQSSERHGYQQFRELWRQKERPTGLVAFPDLVSRGVVLAMLEERVRVPEDLKAVLHRDLEVDLLCPLPVTHITSSARDAARALIEQVQKQARGEPCRPILLSFAVSRPASGADCYQ